MTEMKMTDDLVPLLLQIITENSTVQEEEKTRQVLRSALLPYEAKIQKIKQDSNKATLLLKQNANCSTLLEQLMNSQENVNYLNDEVHSFESAWHEASRERDHALNLIAKSKIDQTTRKSTVGASTYYEAAFAEYKNYS
jgi:hypothetical protein